MRTRFCLLLALVAGFLSMASISRAQTSASGEGLASFVTPFITDCQPYPYPLVLNFIVGPSGLQAGGAVAVNAPPPWTPPQGVYPDSTFQASTAYYKAGYVFATVTPFPANSPGASTLYGNLLVNPPPTNGASLGNDWFVFMATAPILAGSTITFTYTAFPPNGPGAFQPTQTFPVESAANTNSPLQPISRAPTVTLSPGPAATLGFNPGGSLSLGPGQVSPAMNLSITDACGTPTFADYNVTVSLFGYNSAGTDAGANFYSSAGTKLSPPQFTIISGQTSSPSFSFNTSNSSGGYEYIVASAPFHTQSGLAPSYAFRYIQLLASPLTISGASVDSGTPGTLTNVSLTPGSGAGAYINFMPSDSNAYWEVIISSDPTNFSFPVAHRYGAGNPGRTIFWSATNELSYPQQFVPPGTYYVKILMDGGSAANTALSVTILKSASIFGSLTNGAGAQVFASGGTSGAGNSAVADSNGFFQIFGLQNGGLYNVGASTSVVIAGFPLYLSTGTTQVKATLAGTNIGTLAFLTPSLLQIMATLPQPAPSDIWGGVFVHNANYSQGQGGTLHFAAGSRTSDNGAQGFNVAASSWTSLGLPPGTYAADINIPQVNISTRITGIVLGSSPLQLSVTLVKKANIYGLAKLPAASTSGAWVSVQATKAGASFPTVFGGVFIPPALSSGIYSLLGLDPGNWTVSAQGQGFLPLSVPVTISGTTDIGNPSTGGLDLTLQQGGTITGTLAVSGDTSQLDNSSCRQVNPQATSGFCVAVNAYSPTTFSGSSTVVNLATGTAPTSTSFSIGGLADGTYYLNTSNLPGFVTVNASVVVSAGKGSININLAKANASLSATLVLPKGTSVISAVQNRQIYAGYTAYNANISTGFPDLNTLLASGSLQISASSATASLSGLNPGQYQFDAFYAPTGTFRQVPAALSQNLASSVLFDFSEPAYGVSGQLSFPGSLNLPEPGGFTVAVSSIAGFLANTSTLTYCVLTSIPSLTVSVAHLELLPANVLSNNQFLQQPLVPAGNGCPSPFAMVTGQNGFGNPNGPNPFMAYVAPIAPDGSFSFPSVPSGRYLLRNNAQLDLNGDQIPQFTQVLTVTSTISGLPFRIGNGVTVSGNILAPAGTTLSRPISIGLFNGANQRISTTTVNFVNSNSAPYSFSGVAGGHYTILVQDPASPKAYAAKPLSIQPANQDLTGQDIQLVLSGTIKGSIAAEEDLPDGTKQFALISKNNISQFPLEISALADPWFNGGSMEAERDRSNGQTLIDANNQFLIDGLLPGTYDAQFRVPQSPGSNSLSLVSAFVPEILVSAGQTTNLGTARLLVGRQITGHVSDQASKAPLSNISITARPSISISGSSSYVQPAVTDSSGNYVLTGLDPTARYYDIFAPGRGNNGPETIGQVVSAYEQKIAHSVDISTISSVNFALGQATYTISGQVVAPPGGPPLTVPFGSQNGIASAAPGAYILLGKVGVIPTRTPIGDIQAQTDINGNFTVTSLSTGSYKLTLASTGYAALRKTVTISTSSVNLGVLTLTPGATLTGHVHKPDGSNPSASEVNSIVAASQNFTEIVPGSLTIDPNTQVVTDYVLSGFKTGISYTAIFIGNNSSVPDEGGSIIFKSSAPLTIDFTYRPAPPLVAAKATRQGSGFQTEFDSNQPLRAKTAADNDLSLLLSTISAGGTLTVSDLSQDRTQLSASYASPSGVSESSFTLHFKAYTNQINANSADPINSQYLADSTATFYSGISAMGQTDFSNFAGGNLAVEGDSGRLTVPPGAFDVSVSSSILVTLQVANEPLIGPANFGTSAAKPRVRSLRYPPSSYPPELVAAAAAVPQNLNPLSPFYNIFLPLGLNAALSEPVQLTIGYSTSVADPSGLNLYWFNPAANEYVLQQDVTGTPPVIDSANHTITLNINHFSTYVTFQSSQTVLLAASGATSFYAYNFPNPFDLTSKTVNALHGSPQSIRGTMIAVSIPLDLSGNGSIEIFNIAGRRVRTIDLNGLTAGDFYYVNWDGNNDSGRDVASGVYIGLLKVGGRTTSFKMAVIKGSNQ